MFFYLTFWRRRLQYDINRSIVEFEIWQSNDVKNLMLLKKKAVWPKQLHRIDDTVTGGNIYARYRESASGEIKKKFLSTFMHIDGCCSCRFRTCRNTGHLIRVFFFYSKGLWLVIIMDNRENRNPRTMWV